MKELIKTQIFGILLVILGISAPFLVENNLIETGSGILTAIGVALILKWIPFRKRKSS